MKFTYQYRTPDNKSHKGVIKAASRDAAYAALKAQGIKPGRVEEAPGFFNKLFGKGKRWIAICVLGVIVVSLAVALGKARTTVSPIAELETEMRRQVIGDSAIIEKGIRTGWADVFPEAGERFLASFALPGQPPAVASVSEAELAASVERKIEVEANDTIEVRQIKAMVEGLKKEIRDYLAEGGTLAKYSRRLVRRQQEEIGYYQRAEREIAAEKSRKASAQALEKLWEKRNAELRQMGIRLVPMPE